VKRRLSGLTSSVVLLRGFRAGMNSLLDLMTWEMSGPSAHVFVERACDQWAFREQPGDCLWFSYQLLTQPWCESGDSTPKNVRSLKSPCAFVCSLVSHRNCQTLSIGKRCGHFKCHTRYVDFTQGSRTWPSGCILPCGTGRRLG
jgi:hypothetical protein